MSLHHEMTLSRLDNAAIPAAAGVLWVASIACNYKTVTARSKADGEPAMTQDDRLAYSVTETARALHMTPGDVREAIARGLLWATVFGKSIRVPAEELERVRANIARRELLRRSAEGSRRRPKNKGLRAWTFERLKEDR
jgi:hypothetical protein